MLSHHFSSRKRLLTLQTVFHFAAKFELALVFLDSREHTVHTVLEGSADEYPDVA
jgi:hypothetical protein